MAKNTGRGSQAAHAHVRQTAPVIISLKSDSVNFEVVRGSGLQPDTCKIWYKGEVIFDGVSKSALSEKTNLDKTDPWTSPPVWLIIFLLVVFFALMVLGAMLALDPTPSTLGVI